VPWMEECEMTVSSVLKPLLAVWRAWTEFPSPSSCKKQGSGDRLRQIVKAYKKKLIISL
jgi:hypothetical protein